MKPTFPCVCLYGGRGDPSWQWMATSLTWIGAVGREGWVMAFPSLLPEWSKLLWPRRECQDKHSSLKLLFVRGKEPIKKKKKQEQEQALPSWYQVAVPYSLFLHQLDLHFPVSIAASYQSDFCSFVTVLHEVSLSGSHSVLTWSCFDVSALFPLCLRHGEDLIV